MMTADTKGRMFGLSLLGLLIACIAMNTLWEFARSLASERWPRAAGKVVSSSVYRDASDVSPRWDSEVLYQYKVGNQTFTSGRIRFLMGPMYRREKASEIAQSYAVGRAVQIAYDPANPWESVLEPGAPSGMLKHVLLTLFLVIVTGYIYYEIHHPERRILLRSFAYPEFDKELGQDHS